MAEEWEPTQPIGLGAAPLTASSLTGGVVGQAPTGGYDSSIGGGYGNTLTGGHDSAADGSR